MSLRDVLKLIALTLFWLALLWAFTKKEREREEEAAALYYYYYFGRLLVLVQNL